MDLGPVDTFAFPLLTPLFGFSTMSAPQVVADVHEFTEGNWLFSRKVIRRASVDNIVMTRGVAFYDSDFWRWMMMGVTGDTSGASVIPGLGFAPIPPGIMDIGGPTYRRNLLLIQYFPKVLMPAPGLSVLATTGLLAAGAGALAGVDFSPTTALVVSSSIGLGLGGVGPFEFAARCPARAWILKDVIPIRYKVGADFDASASAISMMELEIAYERFEEIALAG